MRERGKPSPSSISPLEGKHSKLHRLLGGQYYVASVIFSFKQAAEVEHLDLRLSPAPCRFRLRWDPAKDQLGGHRLDRLFRLCRCFLDAVSPSRRTSAFKTASATASCALVSAASARVAFTVLCCASPRGPPRPAGQLTSDPRGPTPAGPRCDWIADSELAPRGHALACENGPRLVASSPGSTSGKDQASR